MAVRRWGVASLPPKGPENTRSVRPLTDLAAPQLRQWADASRNPLPDADAQLGRGLQMAGIGLGIGIVLAVGASRIMSSLLFET